MSQNKGFSLFECLDFPTVKSEEEAVIPPSGREEPGRGTGTVSGALSLSPELALSLLSSGSLTLSTGGWGTERAAVMSHGAWELGTRWSRVGLCKS